MFFCEKWFCMEKNYFSQANSGFALGKGGFRENEWIMEGVNVDEEVLALGTCKSLGRGSGPSKS